MRYAVAYERGKDATIWGARWTFRARSEYVEVPVA